MSAPPERKSFSRFLGRAWVDRTIAIVAALPFAYLLWNDARAGELTVPRIAILFQLTLFLITMLIRTPPVRVTANPLFWAVTFVASYYGFLTTSVLETGRPLVPSLASDGLSLVGVAADIYSRVSLGRNIGLVPAQRRLVRAGAYRFVRHPIYGALFVAELSVLLESFSWINLTLSVVFVGLFVIKTLMEERFLQLDPAYAQYMKEVRYRWFPGLF